MKISQRIANRLNQLGVPGPEEMSPDLLRSMADFVEGKKILVVYDVKDCDCGCLGNGCIDLEFITPKNNVGLFGIH